ncbi:MAG: hemolysin family protein [Deltaproteobacteria bacterium]
MDWLLLIGLVAATAFVSAAETAIFALRRVDLVKWKEEGHATAGLLETMLANPNNLISTIFIVNELTNVWISSMIAVLLIPASPYGRVLSLAAGTFVILVLGDLVPKCLAWPNARPFSLVAARPIRLLSVVLAPARFLVERTAAGIVRLFGGEPGTGTRGVLSEKEFRALVDVGEEAGTLDAGEKELIHNIFELTDQRAGEIMTPLADVFMVPAALSYAELTAQFRRYRRSRVPVYEGERQNVVGILYFKDVLRLAADGVDDSDWSALVKPPFVIPTAKKLPILLREFQKMKVHLALVVDEFGEIVGIVTLEDVLEELFGEIREEHDREEKEIVRRPDGSHRVLGKTPIHRFNDAFSASLPDQEWDTVAGLLLHEFGRLPGRGDSLILGPFRFSVERLKGIRIAEVGVTRVPGGAE